jgi:uncharacterized protein
MLFGMLVCPICGRPAAPRAESESAPFCSPRCKLIDLGKWLGEGYRVPCSDGEEADAEAETDRKEEDA